MRPQITVSRSNTKIECCKIREISSENPRGESVSDSIDLSGAQLALIFKFNTDLFESSLAQSQAEEEAMDSKAKPTTSAPAPFTQGDVILRSADRVDFHAYKVVLALASPFFQIMFSLQQPSTTAIEKAGVPIINISENANIIESLLRYCYPIRDPTINDLETIGLVLEAAMKYDMEEATFLLKQKLHILLTNHPIYPPTPTRERFSYGAHNRNGRWLHLGTRRCQHPPRMSTRTRQILHLGEVCQERPTVGYNGSIRCRTPPLIYWHASGNSWDAPMPFWAWKLVATEWFA